MYELKPNPKERKINKRDAQTAIKRALAKYQHLSLNSSDQQVIAFHGGRAYNFSKQEFIMLDEIEEQLKMVDEYFYQEVTMKDMEAKRSVPDVSSEFVPF